MTENEHALQNTLKNLPDGTPISRTLLEKLVGNSIGPDTHLVQTVDIVQQLIAAIVGLEIRLAQVESRD